MGIGVKDSEAAACIDDAEGRFEQMLYHMTHDIRASLRALRVIPDWIEEDLAAQSPPEVIMDHLSLLRGQVQRADRMMRDLTEYSRVGRVGGPACTIDTKDALCRAWTDVGPPPGFTLQADGPLPAITAPPDDVHRMFRALLDNAVRHHDQTTGLIRIEGASDQGGVTFSLSDDGPGIAPDMRDRAMQLMTTLRPRSECDSSGVGLALACKVVERSGGTLCLSGAPPPATRGLCVTFSMPAAPP
ncbi:hypothetical protein ATO6_11890 [Oceanicola sp. 22II-s10i]|uniref:sensor histidine kinase n=1 Tax=Oceanicola sp. 22II-s10i TaxID=1317116 RepID=UPI000B522F1B|nr:HAMP domain-containing sensor histidine kinase [Oceanicola sp. 22II-s10i]OWU84405.1 hypothetical protein ATO6_11890 [Oceanicola sp. 22II-s10i]